VFDFVRVNFPTTQGGPTRVHKLTYRQRNYEHDYAKVYFRDWAVNITRVKPGSPMELVIGGKTFSGYVHDVKSYQDGTKNFTEVGFIGASYVMRQASQQVYRNVTASMIAEKLAKKYGFSYKIVPHPRVFSQVSQAGLTDWEFLVKLAKQCGYFVWMDSTALYFQPLLQEFDEKIIEAPSYHKADAGFKSPNLMYSFNPVIGETLTHHGADKSAVSVAGIDPRSGQYFKYTKQKRTPTTRQISQPELFDRHATNVVAPTYEAAVYEAVGADEKSRFPYIAEAEILGNSRLRPGNPIHLAGVGSKYSGYWTILEVEHEIIEDGLNTQKFTSILKVATDSLGSSALGRYPAEPPTRGIRHISPAVRNTQIKPKSVIKSPTLSVTPAKTVKLVNRINRPADSGPTISQATWSSDAGNLSQKPTTKGRSAAAMAKVVSYFGRQ